MKWGKDGLNPEAIHHWKLFKLVFYIFSIGGVGLTIYYLIGG